jgi:hypothetical protein
MRSDDASEPDADKAANRPASFRHAVRPGQGVHCVTGYVLRYA